MTPMIYLMFFAKVSNSQIKIESSSLIKTFDERRWFIFFFGPYIHGYDYIQIIAQQLVIIGLVS